ncbi:MAG: type II toxin-antitoxin system Phd/YefM family antitoxin [Desulfobacteria bacterium]
MSKEEKNIKTATVGEIQKNFGRVLSGINNGQEIIITKRGKPVARIVSLAPKSEIEWPDFYNEAIDLKGKPIGEIVIEGREDRF